jgi:hypothetical protein
MGNLFIDKFSLLHLASGIVAYYFHIPLVLWILIHVSFEILENTPDGIYFIDHYIKIWPGGKKSPDSLINSLGDDFFAIIGWLIPYALFGPF